MSNATYGLYDRMQNIERILSQAFVPYIIIVSLVGIAGNVLTIIMLSKRSLTKNFNNCTLIALALADLLFNITLISRCISDLKQSRSDDFCRILSFLSHLAELLSACFTVHFTIQRFIAVRFPLSVFIEKNCHFLHYIIIILFILSGISYSVVLMLKNKYEYCEEELALNWFISDALLSFVIPFIIIASLNLLIIFHLRKTSRKNQRLAFSKRTKKQMIPLHQKKKSSILYELNSTSRLSENTSTRNLKGSVYQFQNSESHDQYLTVDVSHCRTSSIRSTTRYHAQSHRVTRMLILVSTCFLLLNAPAHICSISLKVYVTKRSPSLNMTQQTTSTLLNSSDILTTAPIHENLSLISTTQETILNNIPSKIKFNFNFILYIILIITQHIAYLSYSINFFLYSFCGMKFRRELTKFFTRYGKCRKQMRPSHNINPRNSF